MNRCHFEKELSSYLDNQLLESQKQKLEEHLKRCKICIEELSRLKLLSEKLREWRSPCLGPFFENAVKDEIAAVGLEREVKMKKKTLTILVPSGVLAGILVFLFVGGMMQVYVKRGVGGKLKSNVDSELKSNVDSVGEQSKKGFAGHEMLYEGMNFVNGLSRRDDVNVMYSMNEGNLCVEKSAIKKDLIASAQAIDSTRQDVDYAGGPVSPVIVIQPVLPATGEGDKIIRAAEIKLEVEDGKQAYKKAVEICQELGGYLSSSNFYKNAEGKEAGTITMRIPKEKFLLALDKLGALGKVESSSTSSRDVRQEYANLKSQLDAAMVVYNKTLEALQKKQVTIPEAIRLESELTPILRRVQDLKNKIEYLNNAVSYTTIVVNFCEPQISMKALRETKQQINESILSAKISAVKFFAKVIPNLILVLVLLAVLLGGVSLIAYWLIRASKRR